MPRIIVAFAKTEDAKKIGSLLSKNGFDDVFECTRAVQAITAANESDIGVVVCGDRLSDMHYSELYEYLPREFSMLLVAPAKVVENCAYGDILALSLPFRAGELINSVETLLLKTAKWQRRRPAAKRRDDEDKKLIERAKAILMDRNHLSEPEAHKLLQKTAMDGGHTLVETAGMVVDVYSR